MKILPFSGFDFVELLSKFRYPVLILILGLAVGAFGVVFFKKGFDLSTTKVEVLQGTTAPQNKKEITVEISGSVITPGVYKLPLESRVEDLLIKSEGFASSADRNWTDKYLNRAAILNDGQKIYIPSTSEQSGSLSANKNGVDQSISSNFQSDSNSLINVNTASLSELDSLPGIGQVYGQNIIEHRPYSTAEELVSKGAIKQSLFDKIKDRVTVY